MRSRMAANRTSITLSRPVIPSGDNEHMGEMHRHETLSEPRRGESNGSKALHPHGVKEADRKYSTNIVPLL